MVEYTLRVVRYVRDQFEYEPGEDARALERRRHSARGGGGVCQDFAHLTIGLLRLAGVPARYVSGYLAPHAADERAQSRRATPGSRSCFPARAGRASIRRIAAARAHHHIRVAVGRDYADVPPLRGVYRSAGGAGEMRVELSIQREGDTEAAAVTVSSHTQNQAQSQQQ